MKNLALIEKSTIENLINAMKSIQASPDLDLQDMPELASYVEALKSALVARMAASDTCKGSTMDDGGQDRDSDQLIDAKEVARRLDFTEEYVLKLARTGSINSVRHGKYVRFRAGVIKKWISDHTQKEMYN
jgi:excisionase family DNA binding protein